MAGRGRAPKPPEQRRNRTAPQAGEWLTLDPLKAKVLPELPESTWSSRTVAAWRAWQADPVTSQYGAADIQLAIDLAFIYESWVREPTAALAGEIRQRQDSLGLSPKGRQDRRWRLAPTGEVIDLQAEKKSAEDRMREMRERAATASRTS